MNIQINQADVFFQNEEYEEAIFIYEKIIEKEPENKEIDNALKEAYLLACKIYLGENKFNEALNIAQVGHESTKYGKLLKVIEMIESGEIIDEDDHLVNSLHFTTEGAVSSFEKYIYFRNGNLKRVEYYNAVGKIRSFVVYEYDDYLKLQSCRYYIADSNMLYYEEKYSTKGTLNEIIRYNRNGEKIYRETYENQYTNRLVTKYKYDGTIVKNLYNSAGKLKERTVVFSNSSRVVSKYNNDTILEKKIYYNSKDEIINYLTYVQDFEDGLLIYAYDEYDTIQYLYEYHKNGRLYYKYEYDEYESLIEATEYDEVGRERLILWFDYYGDIQQYLLIDYRKNSEVHQYYEVDLYYNEYLIYYDVFEFDKNQNEKKMTSFYADGSLAYYYSNEYDQDGNIIRRNDFDAKGNSDGWIVYETNENAVTAYYYGPDEEFFGSIERVYDDFGHLKKIETFDRNRDSYGFTEYAYDESGNEIWHRTEE